MFILTIISNCLLLLCSVFGFVFGIVKYFKSKKPLFPVLVTCGIGCLMLSHLFIVITLITERGLIAGFNVGKLGLLGGFLFFFSASFGQMDGLVDNRSKELLKYRLFPLIAPAVIIILSGLTYIFNIPLSAQITNSIICVFIAMSAYYNLKHIFIPDVDMGILKCIRPYNILALLLMLLSVLHLFSADINFNVFTLVVAVLISAIYVSILPVLDRGIKKWTI